MPVGAPSFSEALRMGAEVFHALKGTLHERGLATAVGDEGGFAPDLASNEEALKMLIAGHRGGRLPRPARTSRSRSTRPRARSTRTARTCSTARAARSSADELAAYWADLAGRYPIVSLEDGMAEEDWDGWATLTERLGEHAAARRRRPVRDEHGAPAARDRGRGRPTRSSSRSTRSAR